MYPTGLNHSRRMVLRAGLGVGALLCAGLPAWGEAVFSRDQTQYIAALGNSMATSGTEAQTWGLWQVDPGRRGVSLGRYGDLISDQGLAPAGWRFDSAAWWLEEHGLIMEPPQFPLPPGRYVVTGGREVTAILTIDPPDADGKQFWNLADGATIYDVTHLRCRAAVYSPVASGQSCNPQSTPEDAFPLSPAEAMPAVEGCSKQEYQVLIVLGMMVDS